MNNDINFESLAKKTTFYFIQNLDYNEKKYNNIILKYNNIIH